jgi:hypothetical protein
MILEGTSLCQHGLGKRFHTARLSLINEEIARREPEETRRRRHWIYSFLFIIFFFSTMRMISSSATGPTAEWSCATCFAVNYVVSALTCGVCSKPRSASANNATIEDATTLQAPHDATWVCRVCELRNVSAALACGACDAPRDSDRAASSSKKRARGSEAAAPSLRRLRRIAPHSGSGSEVDYSEDDYDDFGGGSDFHDLDGEGEDNMFDDDTAGTDDDGSDADDDSDDDDGDFEDDNTPRSSSFRRKSASSASKGRAERPLPSPRAAKISLTEDEVEAARKRRLDELLSRTSSILASLEDKIASVAAATRARAAAVAAAAATDGGAVADALSVPVVPAARGLVSLGGSLLNLSPGRGHVRRGSSSSSSSEGGIGREAAAVSGRGTRVEASVIAGFGGGRRRSRLRPENATLTPPNRPLSSCASSDALAPRVHRRRHCGSRASSRAPRCATTNSRAWRGWPRCTTRA